jgi:hypothetical protein
MAHLAQDVLRLLLDLGPLLSHRGPPARNPPAAARILWSVEELLDLSLPPGPPGATVPVHRPDAGSDRPEPPPEREPHERRRGERRAFPRRIPTFRLEDPPILELRGRDLSLGGVGVEPSPELGVGARVHLVLAPEPGVEPLLVWARVVRAGSRGTGICFEAPDARDRERLAALVAGLAPAGPACAAAPDAKRISV